MQDTAYLFGIIALILIMGLSVVMLNWQSQRSQDLIEGWANDNHLTVVHKEARDFLRGPMFWSTAKGQTVYRITVRDQNGIERSGWIRCGGRWTGLHSDKVEVRWDSE